jgi:hypothetical protein
MKAHVRANCWAVPHAAIANAFYFSPGSKFCCAKPKPCQWNRKETPQKKCEKKVMCCLGVAFPCSENAALWIFLTSHFQHLHCNYSLSERTPKKKRKNIVFKNVFEGQRPRNTTRKWLSECNDIADINFLTRSDGRCTGFMLCPNGILLLLWIFFASVSASVTLLTNTIGRWDFAMATSR